MPCRLEALNQRYPKELIELFTPIPCPFCGVYHEKNGYTRMYKEDEKDVAKVEE